MPGFVPALGWERAFPFARDRVTLRLGAAVRQGRPAEA